MLARSSRGDLRVLPWLAAHLAFYLSHAYAKPNTTPRIRRAKYTF
jgi:hypothetical protein